MNETSWASEPTPTATASDTGAVVTLNAPMLAPTIAVSSRPECV